MKNITLELGTLVDQHGRCIPQPGLKGVVGANRTYHLVQPTEINYETVLARIVQWFAPEVKFVSAMELKQRTQALLAKLSDNRQVKNLLCNIWLSIVLPQLQIADYGRTLEDIFLAAVERSYRAQFPDRQFCNHRKRKLAGKVSVTDESRHQQLLDAMRQAPVVCLYFPTALYGFGIEADRQTIGQFPEGFALAGAIDTAMAYLAYPETLARDCNVPVSDCAANTWRGSGYSLYFDSYDVGLVFDYRDLDASVDCSGGVVFFG